MRKFYLLVTLFCATLWVQAQTPQLLPLTEANPILQAHAAQQAKLQKEVLERMAGVHPTGEHQNRSLDDCPNFPNDIVEEGQTIFLPIDTFGLNGGTFGDQLVIAGDCGSPEFAEEVEIIGSNIRYLANLFDDDTDLKEDKVCINFFRADGAQFQVEVFVQIRRKGREIEVPTISIDPFEVEEFCLDQSLVELPGTLKCGDIVDNLEDGYDGNGVAPQVFYFWEVHKDLCWTYIGNGFPGTDKVNMTICDSFGICDVFIWNFEVPAQVIQPGASRILFDDFSYDGLYPTRELWIEDRVWRNNTAAFEPPSIGTATFDGLDYTGTPYQEEDGARIGDRLTSHPIDMTGFTEDDDVYLKFYLQRKGLGLQPELLDTFFVEVKNDDGEWQQVGPAYNGFSPTIGFFETEPFAFYALHLDDEDFFHSRFQVRFSNAVNESGIMDVWHLDFVEINAFTNFLQAWNINGDIAWRERPEPLLKNFQSMPLYQLNGFEAQELNPNFSGKIFFQSSDSESIDDNNVSITDLTANVPVIEDAQFNIPATAFTSLSEEEYNLDLEDVNEFSNLVSYFQSIATDDFEKRDFELEYIVESDQDDIYLINDTVTYITTFDKYLSRNDGSAEFQSYIGNSPGDEEMGQHFYLNVPDEVSGVQIMFPRVNSNSTDLTFTIRLYDQEPGAGVLPLHESKVEKIYFPDVDRVGIQSFSNYRFEDEDGNAIKIPLEAGDFWVTIRELNPTGQSIAVGFDRSISLDTMTNIFINQQNEVSDFNSSIGSLMINPVLRGTIFSSNTTDVRQLEEVMTIFPNPTSDFVNIRLLDGYYENYELEIFNNLGQRIKTFPLAHQFSVEDLQGGVYYLKIVNTQTREVFNHKLIKS